MSSTPTAVPHTMSGRGLSGPVVEPEALADTLTEVHRVSSLLSTLVSAQESVRPAVTFTPVTRTDEEATV
ncbi:hypothetical protein [Brevibacterium litoralis]|uniref:hypothetical protein n=1 Tax=Brevibacterium litoralis TaxID=3138935 RepID=UPI0032F008F9